MALDSESLEMTMISLRTTSVGTSTVGIVDDFSMTEEELSYEYLTPPLVVAEEYYVMAFRGDKAP